MTAMEGVPAKIPVLRRSTGILGPFVQSSVQVTEIKLESCPTPIEPPLVQSGCRSSPVVSLCPLRAVRRKGRLPSDGSLSAAHSINGLRQPWARWDMFKSVDRIGHVDSCTWTSWALLSLFRLPVSGDRVMELRAANVLHEVRAEILGQLRAQVLATLRIHTPAGMKKYGVKERATPVLPRLNGPTHNFNVVRIRKVPICRGITRTRGGGACSSSPVLKQAHEDPDREKGFGFVAASPPIPPPEAGYSLYACGAKD